MAPLYAEMNRHQHDSKEQKAAAISKFVREFFRRAREYRDISLPELADRSKIELSALEAFEMGESKCTREIERAYIRACCAHLELEYFCQQAHEFQNPSVKDTKREVAEAALKQFGVMFPGVDYKNLRRDCGALLHFPRRSQ